MIDYFTEHNTFLTLRSPRPQHWYNIAVGRSKFSITLTINTRTNKLGCEVYIRSIEATTWFNKLFKNKDEIESELGFQLDWQELPNKQDSRIKYYNDGDIRDKDSWGESCVWMMEKAESFHKVFSPRVKKL